jgi:hypothetical protein
MMRFFRPNYRRMLLAVSFAVAGSLGSAPASAQVPAAGGPDAQTERVNDALKRGASYLVSVQNPKTGAIHDVVRNETAMTSLALLALGAIGHQPSDPTPEGQAMKRALDFVLLPENQENDGYFGKTDGSRMYGHGITTLMLAEMLGMGADERQDALIREKCRKALELILRSQRVAKKDDHRGGWRYTPDATDSDMSVTCWQTMALRGAKNAGMDVPKESIDLAVRYIKNLYDDGGKREASAGFGYAGRGHETSTTAEGMLALQVCGEYESKEVKGAGERLLRTGIKNGDKWFFYTAYYYAQGMYQRGEKHAQEGRKVIIDVLLPIQDRSGYWKGTGGEEGQGGKVYATSLAMLALAVKNHYLPIYQR